MFLVIGLVIVFVFHRDEYHGKFECEFNATLKLSFLYDLMESLKKNYNIESYAISNQNTLVNIFLDRVGHAK